jgi:malate dehydrogenase (quinone)
MCGRHEGCRLLMPGQDQLDPGTAKTLNDIEILLSRYTEDSVYTLILDVVLVGAGIMGATLAVILKELNPKLKIEMYEVLGSAAQESSNGWNNAGTGHAALCELGYAPEKPDGSIDISEALEVNTEFDLSGQFWAYLVKKGAIRDPQSFIHPVPHVSFVRGPENRTFLKKRFEALTSHPLYYGMEYSDD